MPTSNAKIYGVGEIVTKLSNLVNGTKEFQGVLVKGEVSDYKVHTGSGHVYFTLKDNSAVIAGVMFASDAARQKCKPKVGDMLVCFGSLAIYGPQSRYQLRCTAYRPDGEGEQSQALEELKNKLQKEGLFSQHRPLPKLPSTVAVVTAPDGEAIQDIVRNIELRYPAVRLIHIHALVQGAGAPASIAAGIKKAQDTGADVIIVGRGGGSAEDLAAFDSEEVVRAVFSSRIPTVSAVGHEGDHSLCDLAADYCASTPTAAAVAVVPDKKDIFVRLDGVLGGISVCAKRNLSMKMRAIESRAETIRALSPQSRIKGWEQRLNSLSDSIKLKTHNKLDKAERSVARSAEVISALNPLGVLARGFSVTYCGGRIISDSAELSAGDSVEVRLNSGSFSASVTSVKKDSNNEF